jgi:L-histidine N-alpha-methyltransferase
MRDDVVRGLSLSPKVLSPKYFYDPRGSALFEEITELAEYYPTRTERTLLERWSPVWMGKLHPRSLVELGAGSANKTRILLDAMETEAPGFLFVPLDVSEEFLNETADRLREEYPELTVRPEVADMTTPLELTSEPSPPTLFALLGGTIGNFEGQAAVRLLSHVRATMRDGDAFLLGVDLRPGPDKPVERVEAAYNDARGVTAEFNLNMLRVLNRELGTDFDLGAFRHRAFYNEEAHRIEMHLVAEGPQTVQVPGGTEVRFEDGETVRTEISCKYDQPSVEALLGSAGMRLQEWCPDPEGLFALCLSEPV